MVQQPARAGLKKQEAGIKRLIPASWLKGDFGQPCVIFTGCA